MANELDLPEAERLEVLLEELGEVIQIIGKIKRHGYENSHPDGDTTNRRLLEYEIGHVKNVINMMVNEGDIDINSIYSSSSKKSQTIWKYLYYQE